MVMTLIGCKMEKENGRDRTGVRVGRMCKRMQSTDVWRSTVMIQLRLHSALPRLTHAASGNDECKCSSQIHRPI